MVDPAHRPGRFLLVGAAHVDRIARAGVSFQPRASNPGTLRESIGGASFNAALALRAFGREVDLVTARGGDAAALEIGEALAAAGIGDAAISWLDRATASYTAILDDHGELVAGVADMELYDRLTARVLSRRHIRESLAEAGAVLADANLPGSTLGTLAMALGERPFAVIAVSPAKVLRLDPILPRLAILFLSRAEASALVQSDAGASLDAIAARLAERGVRRAVVTDGPGDVILLEHERVARQSPPHVEAVRDVTGAGDTLAAVTFAEWVDGRPFFEAARVGMAAASLHISTGLRADARVACLSIAAGLDPARLQPA